MTVGILGGGLSGIALQRFLRADSEVLEREDRPGGLCRTFWKDGFGYDIGGHILFSKNASVNALVDDVLQGNLLTRRRANKIFFKGRFMKYPFENDLAALDLEDRYECLIDYLRGGERASPENLADWCVQTFGAGIARKYLLPYNEKIWKRAASRLTTDWVARIPRPPMEDVVKSALGISTEGYLHQLDFRYPAEGGIESLIHRMSGQRPRVTTGFRVRAIEKRGRDWVVSDGQQTRTFERLVVAFPMHEALGCLAKVPEQVLNAAAELRHNAVRVVLLGVKDASLLDKSAVYIPDPEILPHRICYMGYFSPSMVPAGCSSLIAEITASPGTELYSMSDAALLDQTVAGLDRLGIISRQAVCTSEVQTVEYGYPVYEHGCAQRLACVKDWFREQGIVLLGRFAEFDYINMDECILRATRLADMMNREQG